MKRLLLIATGGTIASRQTEEGLVPQLQGENFTPYAPTGCITEALDLLLEDSTDMVGKQQLQLAQCIREQKDSWDGFVIAHGTDTLAYTSAMLVHLLRGLGKPVVLVGSMEPLGTPGGDADENLRLAFLAAVKKRSGVWLACQKNVFPGDRVTKYHTVAHNAFIRRGVSYPVKRGEAPTRLVDAQILYLYPDLDPRLISVVTCQTLILLAFGAGGIPEAILPTVAQKRQEGTKIYVLSQCPEGPVDLARYQVGVRAQRLGVRQLPELTVENAYALARCGLI